MRTPRADKSRKWLPSGEILRRKLKRKELTRVRERRRTPFVLLTKKMILAVQRLSAEVSGKAQIYSRIGAREFVSYKYEEFTIENIRGACEKHFAVDKSMSCDILAGEQGPSCNTTKQIPDSRVIHLHFVDRVGECTELGIRKRLQVLFSQCWELSVHILFGILHQGDHLPLQVPQRDLPPL